MARPLFIVSHLAFRSLAPALALAWGLSSSRAAAQEEEKTDSKSTSLQAAQPIPESLVPEEEPAPPSLSPLKVGTHTFSRFEYRENYDELGVSRARFQEGDQTVFRARLSLETAALPLGKGLEGAMFLAPQASGAWGTSGVGGTIGEANLGIYEGYFTLMSDAVTAKVGRFAMNYGEAYIIGNLDWHQAGRAFDGVHLTSNWGKVSVDVFATQVAEGHPVQREAFLAGDGFFWGAYGQFGEALSTGFAWDLYLLGRSWGAADIEQEDGAGGTVVVHKDAATFVTIGSRVKQKIGPLDYRLEGGAQVGRQQAPAVGPTTDAVDKFAGSVDGEVGLAPVPAFRVGAGGAFASGDDPGTEVVEAYDELYPTTHKWLGLMDVIGFRTNVASAYLNLRYTLPTSTVLKLDGHLFVRPEDGALAQVGQERFAGVELNAQVVQKLGEAVTVRGLYGAFLANDDHYADSGPVHYLELEAGLHF